jgi:hypothetical protein
MSNVYLAHIATSVAALFLSNSQISAQNLHQKYQGSWNCSLLSMGNADDNSLHNACKRCEANGQEFVKTSASDGHCEGSRAASTRPSPSRGSSPSPSPNNLALREERLGDSKYASGDYSAAYDHYLDAIGNDRSDNRRLEAKLNRADCKKLQETIGLSENEDPRAAIKDYQTVLEIYCGPAKLDIAEIQAKIQSLTSRMDGLGRPNSTRPSNNDSTAADTCIDATSRRNGKYWDYKVKNSCGKPVRFDYDDCELSNMKTVCASKSDSVGANDSTMLRSNYMNPPNVRNVR